LDNYIEWASSKDETLHDGDLDLANRPGGPMLSKLCLCVVALVGVAYAKDPRPYQTGNLLRMDSVECTASGHGREKHNKPLCQEYVVQAENVNYRIRPRDEKHAVLLPVGARVQFRMEKDKMVLRTEDFSGKDREYAVFSAAPRSEGNAADAAPTRLNHLQ
jgi:hypothetical protein